MEHEVKVGVQSTHKTDQDEKPLVHREMVTPA